jgi:copper transport protein
MDSGIVLVSRPGRVVAALLGSLLGLAGALVAAAPASAHAALTGTSPRPGVVLPTAPASVTLRFSEPVRNIPGKIRVLGPGGQRVDLEPTFAGGLVTVSLRPSARTGTYLVSYRVISGDSHPVSGGFSYSVGAPSVAGDLPTELATDPVVGALVPVTEYLGYAGLVLLVGPVLMLLALWPERLSRRGPTLLAWLGVGLVGLSTVLALVLQAPYTTGSSLAGITVSDLGDVFGSSFGTVMLVRLTALGATALLLRSVLRGTAGMVHRGLLAILAVAGLATWSMAGHPVATPVPPASVLADFVHIGAMAVWLGGLVILLGFLLRQASEPELQTILPTWSRWAASAVAVLLLAGSVQALIEIRTLSALIGTTYGQLVLVKVGLVGAVLAVAAYSRRLVRRRIAAGRPAKLRRAVGVELAITAAVLVVTTVLVQTTPGRNAEASTQAFGYVTTLTTELYMLNVRVDPAKVGSNFVHLTVYTADRMPQPVLEWKVTAAQPEAGVEPIDIPVLGIAGNRAFGEIALPTAGEWQFRFTLRTTEIDQATVTATVPVT